MISTYLRYILLFIFSILVQVLILDNIYITGYVNIFIYVLFILMLPIETNKFLLLALAFILGFTIDIFNSTPGLHASATVLLAYLRPFVLTIYSSRDGYETNKAPGIRTYGFYWFIRYAITLIFAHHLLLFFLEVFTFSHMFLTLLKVILSSFATLFFVILGNLLFSKE